MKHTEEKYYELQTKPVIAATGGASLGSLFGATGILIGGILGFVVAIVVVLYLYFYKK